MILADPCILKVVAPRLARIGCSAVVLRPGNPDHSEAKGYSAEGIQNALRDFFHRKEPEAQ